MEIQHRWLTYGCRRSGCRYWQSLSCHLTSCFWRRLSSSGWLTDVHQCQKPGGLYYLTLDEKCRRLQLDGYFWTVWNDYLQWMWLNDRRWLLQNVDHHSRHTLRFKPFAERQLMVADKSSLVVLLCWLATDVWKTFSLTDWVVVVTLDIRARLAHQSSKAARTSTGVKLAFMNIFLVTDSTSELRRSRACANRYSTGWTSAKVTRSGCTLLYKAVVS